MQDILQKSLWRRINFSSYVFRLSAQKSQHKKKELKFQSDFTKMDIKIGILNNKRSKPINDYRIGTFLKNFQLYEERDHSTIISQAATTS